MSTLFKDIQIIDANTSQITHIFKDKTGLIIFSTTEIKQLRKPTRHVKSDPKKEKRTLMRDIHSSTDTKTIKEVIEYADGSIARFVSIFQALDTVRKTNPNLYKALVSILN
jgi:hypothetical protein